MDTLVGGEILAFEGFRFNPRTVRLFRPDQAGAWVQVQIGSRALEILVVLLSSPGAIVSRDAIMTAVWAGMAVEPNNLTVHMAALRRVLDAGRSGESCIQTVPGKGYRFALPVTRAAVDLAGITPEPVAGPVAEPIDDLPATAGRRRRRLRRTAIAGAIAPVALLFAVAWHGGWLSDTPAPPRLSIVVLPFQNLSGDANDDYLADAVTDDLTTDLAGVPGMFVIGHGSAYAYRGKAADVRKVGEELGVRYVVEGSMRRLDDALRVDVQLVSAETGAQLWADRFDEQMKNLSAGQDAIVDRLGQTLNIAVTDIESARSKRERPTNPDAFDMIIRARALRLHPMGSQEEATRIALLEQALRLDPTSITALTSLAHMLIETRYWGGDLKRAAGLVAEATAISPDNVEVLGSSAHLLLAQGRYAEAIAAYRQMLDESPNLYFAYNLIGECLMLLGRSEEAIPMIETAIRRAPRSGYIWSAYDNLGNALLMLGKDEESIVWTQRALAANPSNAPRGRAKLQLRLAAAYARLGRLDQAHGAVAEANRIWPHHTARSPQPPNSAGPVLVAQMERFQAALRLAGLRDHADEEADFGVVSDDKLHDMFAGSTPTTAPGAKTIRTAELQGLLAERKPIVIDPSEFSWGRSIPGAIGLVHAGASGSTSDATQDHLRAKMREVTRGDLSTPIVAVGWNSERFDGRNLALRLVALGYTQIYWYRGGREAWETANLPETELASQDW